MADPQERIAVLDLVELLAHEDAVRIVERLLWHDPSPKVRELAALHIEDVLDAEDALGMIDRALAAEEHWGVVAELTRARAEMLATIGDTQNRPVTFSSSSQHTTWLRPYRVHVRSSRLRCPAMAQPLEARTAAPPGSDTAPA